MKQSLRLDRLAETKDEDSLAERADASCQFPAEDCEDFEADGETYAKLLGIETGIKLAKIAAKKRKDIFQVRTDSAVFFFIGSVKSIKARIQSADDVLEDDEDDEEPVPKSSRILRIADIKKGHL